MKIPLITKKKYEIIDHPSQLPQLLKNVANAPEILAYDLETDGPEPISANVIGIGMSWAIGSGVYVVLRRWDQNAQALVDLFEPEVEKKFISDLMSILLTKKLIMHNAPFDVCTTYHYFDHYLGDALHADTILLKHTVNEERPHGLKEIAKIYKKELGIPFNEDPNAEQVALRESIRGNGGSSTKAKYELYKADYKTIAYYGCADCDLTLRVFLLFEEKLKREGRLSFFYQKEVMPLCRLVTIMMKLGGINVDVKYFETLKTTLEDEASEIEEKIFLQISKDAEEFATKLITEHVPISRIGDFAKAGLRYFNLPVPIKPDGSETVSKTALSKLSKSHQHHFLTWLLWNQTGDEPKLNSEDITTIRRTVYEKRYGSADGLFNLRSTDHLRWLLFEKHGLPINEEKRSKKTKKAAVDEDVLQSFAASKPFVKDILALRKVEKLLSTYVIPILAKQLDGRLYPDMLQFGTTSGRYSCGGGLNLQTLPRDDVRIKRGFIAPKGYKIVNADFSSLEPRIFCWVSGDPDLKEIFQKGLDFYSKIAIDVLGMEGFSADPEAQNYLKNLMPDKRQDVKGFALAVPYGANAYRLHMETGRPLAEHREEIEAYLAAYPGLKQYMRTQERMAREKGFVETRFGRVRHLWRAKKVYEEYENLIYDRMGMAALFAGEKGLELYQRYQELRETLKQFDDKNDKIEKLKEFRAELKEVKDMLATLGKEGIALYQAFRSDLNNAKNAPIQMTAAHAANAAAIKYQIALAEKDIDGYICLQIHDELCSIIREDQAELAATLLKDAMENNWVTEQMDIPILAEPKIADNLADAK